MPAMVPHRYPALVRHNRRGFATWSAVREFRRAKDWLDPGERAATEEVAELFRSTPILDIGAGGGRTAPLLTEFSQDYTGVDYVGAMVRAARARFPGLRWMEADARDLRGFPDQHFGLVNMSYNMIDSVDPEGREKILREAWRVLRPGGVLIFSSLNRNGPGHGEGFRLPGLRLSGSLLRRSVQTLRFLRASILFMVNRWRGRQLAMEGGDTSAVNMSAVKYRLVALFVSRSQQLTQLRELGYDVLACWSNTGRRLREDEDDSDATWIHYVARKPLDGGAN